jgi:hypothetical protein
MARTLRNSANRSASLESAGVTLPILQSFFRP